MTFIYLLFGLNIRVAEAAGSKSGNGVNEPNVEGVKVLVFWKGVKIFKGAEGANVSKSCW